MLQQALGILLIILHGTVQIGIAATAEPHVDAAILGGTIVSIDQEAVTITLRLPTGESRSMPVSTPRLLHGLSIGDHVSFTLNQRNQLVTIIKLPTDPAN